MIAVGVSGGVDSSVSALLLAKEHTDVRGVFMHNWEDDGTGECRADVDRRDALRVCAAIGIPFASRNFAKEYKENVFAEFLEGYARGVTPNPDILCNREVKFKVFLEDCLNEGAEFIATGHYVRKGQAKGRSLLLRGVDPSKDQSYFLHAITHDALSRALFPIGHLPKSQVRTIAEEAGLVTARKKDSTGICFIGEQDFKTFLRRYLPAQDGEVVTEDGRVVGTHGGALYYTVGQRAPIGGVKGCDASVPWFVLHKDVANNRLVVGQGHDHPALVHDTIVAERFSWIDGRPPSSSFEGEVQVRHLGQALPARIDVRDDGTVRMSMHRAHRAAAIGQSAVVYQGDVCLGGGEIVQAN